MHKTFDILNISSFKKFTRCNNFQLIYRSI